MNMIVIDEDGKAVFTLVEMTRPGIYSKKITIEREGNYSIKIVGKGRWDVTAATDKCLVHLKDLRRLQSLHTYQTEGITNKGTAELKKWLPRVVVYSH